LDATPPGDKLPQHHDEVIATGRIKVIQMNGSQSEGVTLRAGESAQAL